ncbi:hypothetical protein [Streptomyces sp. NPDC127532]|uniref:hypothetical protein n=1 Tax=Streptomyces sp. NPDC127532 TaxID=3345399 RepID=UPI0036448FD0
MAHGKRSAAAKRSSSATAGAGSSTGVSCGAGEAGCWRWASSMVLEAARPRPVVAGVSAMRSR